MRKISAALTIVALFGSPVLAAGPGPGKGAGQGPGLGMKGQVPGHGMNQEMMRNPQYLLMKAYHKNVINFGQALYGAAEQDATVPASFARAAIAEMRRSTEEMEKYRTTALRDMQLTPERQKMMDEHLVQVKTHLRELENLARSERIDSEAVKKHLEGLLAGCQGAGCGPRAGMGPGGYGRHPGMQGALCRQMTPERGMMMEKMMRKMKEQDAELQGIVQEMESARGDSKLNLVAEAIAKMVRQRADLTADMEKMQRHMLQGQGGYMPQGVPTDLDDDDDTGEDEGMEEN